MVGIEQRVQEIENGESSIAKDTYGEKKIQRKGKNGQVGHNGFKHKDHFRC